MFEIGNDVSTSLGSSEKLFHYLVEVRGLATAVVGAATVLCDYTVSTDPQCREGERGDTVAVEIYRSDHLSVLLERHAAARRPGD